MQWTRFEFQDQVHFGFMQGSELHSIGIIGDTLPQSVAEVIGELASKTRPPSSARIETDDLRLLAPVWSPEKVICIGRNYAEHAAEMDSAVGELPVVFSKFPSSLIGPNQNIRLPDLSAQVDYEAELVAVIGRQARQVDPARAMEYVFGYCCGNDVSARDWQKGRPGGQWLLGKTFDTFAPIGPWLQPRDRVDVDNLDISLRLNGQLMQAANTSKLIFKLPFLIAHLSRFCTLQPGDLIFTGTPAGVGAGRVPPVFLADGDEIEIEISGIGVLKNRVVADH